MEVNLKNADLNLPVTPVKTGANSPSGAIPKTEATVKDNEAAINTAKEKEASPLSREDAQHITKELNKFLQLLNADLQFTMHEKTQRLMVQVVDTKENKVLREFPSHELLDTIAKIRDYVGFLLDKKV